jgi:ribosome-binding ATPase YchF (GTP1/OBG family)
MAVAKVHPTTRGPEKGERMTKEAKRDAEWTALNKAIEAFEKEVPLRDLDLAGEEERAVSGFRFLTRLPVLLVLNVGEESMKGEPFPELSRAAEEARVPLLRLCAKVEEEIAQLSPAEQAEFLKSWGPGNPRATAGPGRVSTRCGTSPS